jgi:DNA-binding transcriptional ArsR family regulator
MAAAGDRRRAALQHGKDKDAYLAALRSMRRETLSLETWIQYFLDGLANEYERVGAEIERLSVIGRAANGQRIQLSQSQQEALTDFKLRNIAEFNRREYQEAVGVSRATATSDLNALADAGVLDRLGDGPRRRYRFPNSGATNPWGGRGGGRPRTWTDERIEKELREFVGPGTRFPPVATFRAANRMPLYGAVTRNGGTTEWSKRLTITPPRRGS